MSLLDLGLKFEGLPDKTIADIDAAIPALTRLVALYQQAAPDLAIVAPVIEEVLAFLKQKG